VTAGYCFERDAANNSGPDAQTAPGRQVASKLTSPYTGYTIEAQIRLGDLPTAVDPEHVGLNVLVSDSDTRNKIGKTRVAWSPYPGVQGDPYRWGVAGLDGDTPPPGRPTTPPAPRWLFTPAKDVDSPQSILQAAQIGLPLAGGIAASGSDTLRFAGHATVNAGTIAVPLLATGPVRHMCSPTTRKPEPGPRQSRSRSTTPVEFVSGASTTHCVARPPPLP
jgi:hypothetical protein